MARKQREWLGSGIVTMQAAGPTNGASVDILSAARLEPYTKPTIARIHGWIFGRLGANDNGAASEPDDQMSIQVLGIICSHDVPNPRDDPEREWMWHGALPLIQGTPRVPLWDAAIGAVRYHQGSMAGGISQFAFTTVDVRAMRKVPTGCALKLVMQGDAFVNDGQNPSLRAAFRVLVVE